MSGGNVAKNIDTSSVSQQAALQDWINFKEAVKEQYLIDRAIEEFSGTRLDGRPGQGDRKGLCLFHNDSNPSMNVRPQEGYFRCHTAGCEARGDVFAFISMYQNVSFKQAVLMAAEKVGIAPPSGLGTVPTYSSNKTRPFRQFENTMNPAKLFESDLVPAFRGSRAPRRNEFFPVWHPGGGRTLSPTVKRYKPEMVHIYRDMSSYPVMVVLRCLHRDGGKYFMPIRIGKLPNEAPKQVIDDRQNNLGWIVKGTTTGHRKPIYGMESASDWIAKNGKRILIVEGEKTCDAARRMIAQRDDAEDWLILSPMGGHNASLYADWTEFMLAVKDRGLSDVKFAVWPDADHIKTRPDGSEINAQELYVRDTIGAFITAMRKADMDPTDVSYMRSLPGTTRENGWDLADAEKEGWDGDKVVLEIDDRGMKMAIEKRFIELDVHAGDGSDPAPFEDGPEEIDHLTTSGLSDEEDDEIDVLLGGDETPVHSIDIPDAEIVDELEETRSAAQQLFGDDVQPASLGLPADAAEVVTVADADHEIIDINDNGEDDITVGPAAVHENNFFRALGYRECTGYYMSMRAGEIYTIPIAGMKKQSLLGLAPLRFWQSHFASPDRNGRMTIDWDEAISAMVEAAYDNGIWDPKKEVGQGARIDYGRVVFNTGDRLWIQNERDGDGVISTFAEFQGEYHYTIGDSCGLPDFDGAFTEGDHEPAELLNLIKEINWREGSRKLSVMALFGWLCIGPICGVLPWRPHLWLDGQRAAGKSWIIDNIIKPTLGDYAIRVKSNSTESGLRNVLHGRAFPLVFDEAEGEADGDRNRMKSVLAMARHSATPGDSIVAQGVAGGNGQRFFSIASTFLLSSITPQLEASADKTRFARARLGPGHHIAYFTKHLENPAMDLLTPEFSSKMIGRMVKRAGSICEVQRHMVRGLTSCGIERRLADVWGTYAAGAWCLLKDGVPEDFVEALSWIEETFEISDEIREAADEISDDKDHARLFRHLMAHEVRCETVHLGARNFNLGSIIHMAITEADETDEVMDMRQANKRLAEMGIRLGHKGGVAKEGEKVDSLIIHKNSPRISEILSRTPYAASYVDVIQQAENVKNGPPIRFGGLGTYRSAIVPLEHFPVSGEGEEHGYEEKAGGR